jgi:hypothetical protein
MNLTGLPSLLNIEKHGYDLAGGDLVYDSNSNSKRSLRWLVGFAQDRLVEGSSTFPLSISLPEGESTLFTLSLWERVAEGRVRASVAFFLAALISSLI